jgi:predicted AAA+ superfamily ATPase
MRNIILHQREERDRLLSLPYINRQTTYPVDVLLQSPMIKLITGPRRVGKSVFALLALKNTNFAYLNFDDNQLLANWNEDIAMQTLHDVYLNFQYLLLDEVQNLPNWDLWVTTLYRRGYNLIITGSNARMLSQEMATVLTGRYIPIAMYPFSLPETLQWYDIDPINIPLESSAKVISIQDDYLRLGGYPEIIKTRALAQSYLSTLYDSILLKDVAKRHKIRNTEGLYNLAGYLLANFCNLITANDITNEFGLKSVTTTQKFLNYLHEPYLFFYLQRFNNKLKVMKKAARKVYVVDNGFVSTTAFNISENLGRLLENQVFVELIRQGYDTENTLFYYRSRNDKEVDFVTRKGVKVEKLIQVCYDLTSEKTRRREIDALIEVAGELKCQTLQIISYQHKETIEEKSFTIQVIPFMEWVNKPI